MPAKSEAQRRYLYATKGAAWVRRHHFDNEGKLPEHVGTASHEEISSRLKKAMKKVTGR